VKYRIFISGVQKELKAERRAIKDFVHNDPLCRRYFDVFLFEDIAATGKRPDKVYLNAVKRSSVYIGLFGNEYGAQNAKGLSPTEYEFDYATALNIPRLVFIKNTAGKRLPKMAKLISKAERQLVRRRFTAIPDLTAHVYAGLVQFLEDSGDLHTMPFDAAPCRGADIKDISEEGVSQFLETARTERKFALDKKTPVKKALSHLDLLHEGRPSHAAVLLFGKKPQGFRPLKTAEVKCLHFHTLEVRKPIPSYQIYKETLFEQVDQAVDFVLSKLNRSVTPGKTGSASDVAYEIPRLAVREAIVNAIAHRDYTSNASVQVMLFPDRLEVWNPGELPAGLTPDGLRREHPSIPRNPLICDPLFLAHYAEKAGTGTLDMIALCREAGLPTLDFEQRGNQFVLTIWRDWLTAEKLASLNLNDRQIKAAVFIKEHGGISRKEYVVLAKISPRMAHLDLIDLVHKRLISPVGKGRSVKYVLRK
jgi:predicted HTH transcriptional regulator